VEIDPEQLWSSVVDAGRRAVQMAGNPSLTAIGLANQGETVVPWDRATGRSTGPAIVWQDRRSTSVCDRLTGQGARLAQLTGLTLDPYFVAPKIAWLHEQRPSGTIIANGTVTTTDTWLLHRLCGGFVTDVATAGRSLLLDLDRGEWNEEACGIFGLDPSTLPAVVGNAELLGHSPVFGGSVPVTGACVDQQAALFGEQCRHAGEAKCTYGTGAFLLACTGGAPRRSTHGLAACPAWRLDDELTWCLDGQVYTVGSAVTWLVSMGILQEPADLDRLGGSVSDSGGVSFVPALAGLAAPWWKPEAKAAFTGLSLGTERSHIARAAIEGIAAQVTLLAHATGADLGTPLTSLRVDGGLTRSRTLLQVQADLLQCPVEVFPSPHATALGVAAFAARGAGAELALPTRGTIDMVEPRISADEAAARLGAWQRAADATMGL
jgi:glycerol kinase